MRQNLVRVVVSAGLAVGLWAAGFQSFAGLAVAEDDPVVAKVNGAEIRASEVMRAESRLPARLRASPPSVTLPALITLIIDQRVMADEARKQGLTNSPEVQEQLRFVEEMVLEQVLLQRYLDSRLTDAKIKERYDKIVADMKARDQVRARHILVETEEEAKELIRELQKGADFEKLAESRSIGPSKESGGDLGYFNREQMVPEFSKVAFDLKRGAFTTTPVKTQFGWHVIKVEDRRKLKPPKFNDIKDAIREELAQELRAAYVKELRRDADIVRYDQPNSPASGSKQEAAKGDAAKSKSDAVTTKGDAAKPLWHKYVSPKDDKAKPVDKPK